MSRPALPPTHVSASTWERVTRMGVFALAGVFLFLYVGMALLRIHYPFAIEWVESGVLQGVHEVAAGRPLFTEPSLRYIPFNYPPLYYYVCAPLLAPLGGGFFPLRLVSFVCSLLGFALIGALVWRETRSRSAALVAAGLYAATYEATAVWFDLARADSLHVLLVLAAIAWARWDRTEWRGAVAAGALFGLSFLTKQSGLTSTAPFLLWLIVTRPRFGLLMTAAFAAVAGGASLAFHFSSNGWYDYFIFTIPRGSPVHLAWLPYFWIHDAGRIGFALVVGAAWVVMAPRQRTDARPGDLAAWAVGLLLSCWWVRLYSGAGENNVMPIAAGAAVLFGLGWHELLRRVREAGAPTWGALLHAAVIMQFLALGYFPPKYVPNGRDLAAGRALVERVRAIPGPVLFNMHPYLAEMAGKPGTFHGMAFAAVLFSGGGEAARLTNALSEEATRTRHFAAIIYDRSLKRAGDTTPGYRLSEELFQDSDAFWTRCGAPARPELVYVPADSSAR